MTNFKMQLQHYTFGRVLLHLGCLLRGGRWAGIQRGLRGLTVTGDWTNSGSKKPVIINSNISSQCEPHLMSPAMSEHARPIAVPSHFSYKSLTSDPHFVPKNPNLNQSN